MKTNRRMILSIFWIALGAVLVGCSMAGLLDDYWCGMGGGFLGVGVVQTIRNLRYLHNAQYREKADTANGDERNRFIANKAWAWAGYLTVMTGAAATIAFQLLGKRELSQFTAISICVILVFYWVSYLVLQKKY